MDLIVERRLYLGDKEEPDAYIPMRNMFLAMIGALYGDTVYMVFQKGEQSIPDRSMEFLLKSSELLSFLNGRKIVVDSPFKDLTKAQMVGWYLSQGREQCPIDVLYKAFSCFEADSTLVPCGQCPACFRKWVAFDNNGLDITFHSDIRRWPGIKDYVRKVRNGEYDSQRAHEIETTLRRHNLWKL
jgi:7-cyano-7-deazaguanine synthase in queuosine biosynthesis